MEKLDKPCKRGGKTITHRVVCGKVKKMSGGGLSKSDFKKREDDNGNVKFDKIALRPHIFFGEVKENEEKYYEYVIFNIDYFNKPFRNIKKVGFKKLNITGSGINVIDIDGESILGKKNNYQSNNRNNENNSRKNNNENNNVSQPIINHSNNTKPINYENNKSNLLEILYNLLYCKKLTDYKTIRKTIYDLLKDETFNEKSLFEELNIPDHFFEMDYLPVVITAEEECVPDGFYKLIPEKIEDFLSIHPNYKNQKPAELIAETNASKRPNFFKRKVYHTVYDPNKYIYFSKKKDSEYYNIAVVCNENDTVYIGIYNKRTGIVKFYPIDKNIFSRFTYPSDFIDLVYLYYPYIHCKYSQCNLMNGNKINPDININLRIKILEFYSEYISSTIKMKDKSINLNEYIKYIKNIQKNIQIKEQKERRQHEQHRRQKEFWQESQPQQYNNNNNN